MFSISQNAHEIYTAINVIFFLFLLKNIDRGYTLESSY